MTFLHRIVPILLLIAVSFPAAAQTQPFTHGASEHDAQVFESYLHTDWPTAGNTAAGWRAKGQDAAKAGNPRAAAGYFASAAVLDSNDARSWLALARAYLAIATNDGKEQRTFPRNAGSSALIAYQRGGTPDLKAAALAVLGESLARRAIWRPAINAYRASLDLQEQAATRTAYDQLVAEHGFRMLDYTVDSEAAPPRLCVQFSEPLARGAIDIAKFVSVNGDDPAAVKADDYQLCIEELLHGRRYQVRLRNGLPSSLPGEVLAKPIDLTVYVRDRKPLVRFTGRNYVLPRLGQQGIPVITVNTKLVKAQIYRIGDRRLAPEVLEGEFGQQIAGWRAEQIKDSQGELLWTGEMPVKMRLNDEVTTAFPIDELLPGLKAGLYVMVARPDNDQNSEWDQQATQWFVVSDLGLTALTGQDGIHAFVRSLGEAEALSGVELRLIARNNEVLATASSDERGYVRFEAGLTRGRGGLAPALLVARDGQGDYGFLDLTRSAFDLSDRGVGGRQAPGPLDALVFAERGVYRPGETVYITALLRDADGRAVRGVPLTLKLFRPDNVEHLRQVTQDQGDGGRSLTVPLEPHAATGTWRVSAHADPKGPAIGELAFLVEDYTPERLEMTLTPAAPTIAARERAAIKVAGRYLYGAPAADLALEGDVTVTARTGDLPAFPGYRFGLEDESFTPMRKPLFALPRTDAEGRADIAVELPELAGTTRPLAATVAIRLREPGGRVLAETVTLDVEAREPAIGIKPLFQAGHVAQGEPASFDVVVMDRNGRQIAAPGLTWELVKLESRFQWYHRDGRWDFEVVEYDRRAANGTVAIEAGAPGRIEAALDYGRYRLEVTAPGQTASPASVTFSSGWYVSETADTPDILDLALDKASYRPGDEATVRILPRMAGEAVVAVVSDRLLGIKTLTVPEDGASATFTVGDDWGPGAYITAMLYRPMDMEAKRLPGRAIGVKWLGFDAGPRSLGLAVGAPERTRPNRTLSLPVTLTGLAEGEQAHVTVAAVDVGILNLTDYQPPAPDRHYFGQRRLGTEIRDLYGRLIDGMQGVRGTIRSGGDGAPGGVSLTGRPLSAEPVAFHSGIVTVDEAGRAGVTFDIPAFDGTLRVMAVAWSGDKLGHAVEDVVIRDPVVVQATPPRFLTIGDSSEIHLSLQNVEGPAGDYRLGAVADGGLSLPAEAGAHSIALEAGGRAAVTLPLTAEALGRGAVSVTLSGPDGLTITRSYALTIAPAAPNVTRRTVQTLAAKSGALSLGADLIADLIPETAKVSVNVGRSAALDVPGLLLALDRYPFGCAEQIVSRALPLLYLNEVAEAAGVAGEAGAAERIEAAIARVAALQDAGGNFGLWYAGAGNLWLTAYVTDFLVRAQEQGYRVGSTVLEPALDRLKNAVNYAQDFTSGGEDIAYALYVLARAGRAVVGDLRYYADTKIDNFATPLAQAQIGAALAMYGDKERAERAFSAAMARLKPETAASLAALRDDYGTALRDGAAALTLISETGTLRGAAAGLSADITRWRAAQSGTTTQENAWMLLAARALMEESRDLAIEVDGTVERGAVTRVLSAADLETGLRLRNNTDQPLPASVIVSGASATPEPAAGAGFTIERRVFTADGKEIAFDRVRQNERFVVVLKVREDEAKLGHIVVEDRLPAGFEIENPKLIKGSDIKAFSWLSTRRTPAHTEFRDDRFTAAFSLTEGGRRGPEAFDMAYVVRAVAPGRYLHPGAFVEDMYRPDRFARTAASHVEITRE